jgi:hypothetical protein|tara:strand:+ start:172 stop:447 length:276 start_codon:yes stop_codon:yes gene_type:complete
MSKIINDVLATKTLEDLVATAPAKAPTPKLTTKKVEEAVVLLKEIEKNNGYLAIAGKVGLTQAQIVEIHKAINVKISELHLSEEASESITN